MSTPPAEFLQRLEGVEERLRRLSSATPPAGALTEPDPSDGEQWEWGQVWAHTAEFPAYWTGQIRDALTDPSPEPPHFGRIKTDPHRIGAIDRDRDEPVGHLMERLENDLQDLAALIAAMTPEEWSREVRHQTRGIIAMPEAVESFLVGHLEEHAEQLEGLLTRSA